MNQKFDKEELNCPSFLLKALSNRVNDIKSFYLGINPNLLNKKVKSDPTYRKNLRLEIQDIESVVLKLNTLLK